VIFSQTLRDFFRYFTADAEAGASGKCRTGSFAQKRVVLHRKGFFFAQLCTIPKIGGNKVQIGDMLTDSAFPHILAEKRSAGVFRR